MSRLFKPIQNLNKFFRCPMCIGFWIGFILEQSFYTGCIVSIGSYTWWLLMKNYINKHD